MLNIEDLLKIKKLYEEGKKYDEISLELDIPEYTIQRNCSNNCKILNQRINKFNNDIEEEKRICNLIKDSNNLNCVCQKLGKRATNNNYSKLRQIVKKYDIDTSHFKFSGHRGKRKNRTMEEYFTKNSNIGTSIIHKKLLKFGLKLHKCEKCQRTTWVFEDKEYPIPLEVHHIDGDRTNNELNNLMLLCSNCHRFTDNYCGKNIQNKTELEKKERCYTVKVEPFIKKCKNCGKEFETIDNSQKFCSLQCAGEDSRKCIRPKKEELEILIREKSYKELSRQFGVTDNAIKKWCIYYGIKKYKKKDLGLYYREHKNICENCGKEFNGNKQETKFCSKECEIKNIFENFKKRIKHISIKDLKIDMQSKKYSLSSISQKYNLTRNDMYRLLLLENMEKLLNNQPKGKPFESVFNLVQKYKTII